MVMVTVHVQRETEVQAVLGEGELLVGNCNRQGLVLCAQTRQTWIIYQSDKRTETGDYNYESCNYNWARSAVNRTVGTLHTALRHGKVCLVYSVSDVVKGWLLSTQLYIINQSNDRSPLGAVQVHLKSTLHLIYTSYRNTLLTLGHWIVQLNK